ncbi:MAG: dihydrodipicolinate synthase family protein, partial [Clostridia bacterium]|nr:dihydrodipicolinate synthase family protein [Clostridia bacterium]
MEQYRGIFPAMVTPFDAKGAINYDSMEELIEKFVSEDLDGVYITGSTGEFPLLTFEERKEIIKHVCGFAGRRLKTIVHVGSSNMIEAQGL